MTVFVYEVRSGDSLYSIAMRYRTSPGRLRDINGLTRDAVTVGQALLVPSRRYIVQPGDTPERIAARTGVPWNEFGVSYTPAPGEVLTIPWRAPWTAYVRGYLPLVNPGTTAAMIGDWDEVLSDVCMFAHIYRIDGTIRALDDREARDFARSVGAGPFAAVANIGTGGVFDPDIVDAIVRDPNVRATAIRNTVNLVTSGGYAGLDVDLERVAPEDRANFPAFLRELGAQLNVPLSIAASPQVAGGRYEYGAGLDYAALGPVVDLFYLMAYDFHWTGGPPGAIAPLPNVVEVLDYAAQSGVEARKIIVGMPTTAYDWPISGPGPEPRRGTAYSAQRAVEIAVDHYAEIQYDSQAQAPWFRYVDDAGVQHEVWFEDARSLLAKVTLFRDRGLRGIGFWELSSAHPQAVTLVNNWITPERI